MLARSIRPFAVLLLIASSVRAEQPAKTDLYGDPLPKGAIARFGTVRWRTGDQCLAMAYAPDGKTLISVDPASGCCIWDVATGKKLGQFGSFVEPQYSTIAAAISTDGSLAALACPVGIEVWDVATSKCLWQAKAKSEERWDVAGMEFSPDGKTLARRDYCSAAVTLFESRTGRFNRTLPGPKLPFGVNTSGLVLYHHHSLAFSPDGESLFSAGERGPYCMHELATGESQPASLNEDSLRFIDSPVFSPDGKWLAWLEGDAIYLMDRNWKRRTLAKPLKDIQTYISLCFSPDGKTLACLDNQRRLHFWNPAAGVKILDPPENLQDSYSNFGTMAFAPDGKTLAVSSGPAISFFDVRTGKRKTIEEDHSCAVEVASLSPDGKRLVSRERDGQVCIWNTGNGKKVAVIPVSVGSYCYPAKPLFTPDGKAFATTHEDNQICIFDLATGAKLRRLLATQFVSPFGTIVYDEASKAASVIGQYALPSPLHMPLAKMIYLKDAIREPTWELLRFSSDGKKLLTLQSFAELYAWWDVAAGQQIHRFKSSTSEIKHHYIEIDGQDPRFATFSGKFGDTVLMFHHPKRKSPLWTMATPHISHDVVYDPRGKNLAISGNKMRVNNDTAERVLIRLIEAHTGKDRRAFSGSAEHLAGDMIFSPDGRFLLESAYKFHRLWDITTGRLLCKWTSHIGQCTTCSFSPDGKYILTGGSDTTLLLWDIAELTQSKKPQPPAKLTPADLNKLWTDMADSDAAKAYAATWALADSPEQAVPFLKTKLKPWSMDEKKVQQWIADLDSEQFAVREKANAGLAALRELAEPSLRQALVPGITLEKKRRLELLIDKSETDPLSPDQIRDLRAVEALEIIGTRPTLELLELLATGLPQSRLTQDAIIAVRRLREVEGIRLD